MKKIILIVVVLLLSCGRENNKELKESSNKHDTVEKSYSVDSLQLKHKTVKDFKFGQLYNDSELSLGSIYVNYNSGKYKFEEEYPDFLVDSTLTEDERYNSLLNLENESFSAMDKNVICVRNFAVSDVNNQGNLLTIFFKKEKRDKWKVIDIIKIGKAIDMKEYQYKMEGNQYLCFSCYNNKHNQYFGVVINKIDKSGKYEKVLRAFKFDLEKEKIVEINLKREKIECFPEIGDE